MVMKVLESGEIDDRSVLEIEIICERVLWACFTLNDGEDVKLMNRVICVLMQENIYYVEWDSCRSIWVGCDGIMIWVVLWILFIVWVVIRIGVVKMVGIAEEKLM